MSPSPVPGNSVTAITNARGAMQSATVLIGSFASRQQAAIDQAMANGATEAELAPLIELNAAIEADTQVLAQAVAANP